LQNEALWAIRITPGVEWRNKRNHCFIRREIQRKAHFKSLSVGELNFECGLVIRAVIIGKGKV
jgi:hypothetical protein